MEHWTNQKGEVITREAHTKEEDQRCWDGPEEHTRHDGRKYFRYITRDHYTKDVQRLGNMTRMDVMVTVCVSRMLPVNIILDPLFHGTQHIRTKIKEIYPNATLGDLTLNNNALVCEELMNGDIIYIGQAP